MEQTDAPSPRMEYDLSTKLVKASTTYEECLGRNWLLFAPDRTGWPVIVPDWIHALLDRFDTLSAVGDVLSEFPSRHPDRPVKYGLETLMEAVAFLEDGGFLRTDRAELPYPLPDQSFSRPPKSVGVWLHITNACNLTCSYCFVTEKNNVVMSTAVSEATVSSLARTAVAHGLERVIVKFAGGEPTLVMPAVERFRDQLQTALEGTGIGMHTALLSNGTRITERVIEFLRRPNSSISISLDGYGDAHNIYRCTRSGSPTWQTIRSNIERLQNHGISPYIMATISDRTRHSLPELVQWTISLGLRTRLSVVREPHRGSDQQSEFAAYAARMASSFTQALAVLEAEELQFDPRLDFEICELRFDHPAYWVACGIGANHLVVKTDGTMVSCPMMVDRSGRPPGDDMLSACRQTFPYTATTARSEGMECLSCRWFPVCAGGCPVTNELIWGHPFARSPLCAFFQSVIPRYLSMFGKKLEQQHHRLQTEA